VVSCPDLTGPQEAKDYAQKIHQLVRTLKISSADMEKGQMRLEANISLKKDPKNPLPNYKVEIKNINSFRYLHDAIVYEINRQSQLLSADKKIVQETRGYNPRQKTTFSQRTKEEAYEYRYFPEPDIPPLDLKKLFRLDKLKKSLPELPKETITRLINQYHLSPYQADILVRKYPDRAEKTLAIAVKEKIAISETVNAIINRDYPLEKTTPEEFVDKIKSAQESVLISGDDLKTIVNQVVRKNPKALDDYRTGKRAALGFLIGQVQQKTKGGADIVKTKTLLIKILNRG